VRLDETPGREEPIFKCYYTLSDKAVGLNALTTRPEGEDGTFLLLISPSKFYDEAKLPPVDFTFILDTSGSMGDDDKIGAAKKALRYCLGSLRNVDAFNIIRFSTEVEPFEPNFIDANEENVKRAKTFVDGLRASGGTNIDGALAAALGQKPRKDRLHTILFITDGMPTVGITNVDQILTNVEKINQQRLRVFACGVGYDVNTKLLDRVAEKTRSVAQYIRPKEDLEVSVSQLFDKISRPVLTDLRIEWGELKVRDVYPKELPDLFAGTQLTVFGRYKDGGERAITLTGKVGGEEKKFVYEAKFPTEADSEHAFIQTLWATRRVGYLLDQIRVNGESAELRDEVVQLAKKHGIVTPYTSYLVQEDRPAVAMEPRTRGPVTYNPAPGAMPTDPAPRTSFGATYRGGGRSRETEQLSVVPPPMAAPMRQNRAIDGSVMNADQFAVGQPGVSGRVESRAKAAAYPVPSTGRFMWYGDGAGPAVSGEAAVEYSRQLGELKSATTVERDGMVTAGTKIVAGRTFAFSGGVWAEAREKKDKEAEKKTLKIKYLSDAYFDLVKLRPDLKSAFALGERVELDINDYHVVIGPEGDEKIEKAQLDELAAKKK
jgi:Ca-activated chloride channel family protein